MKEAQGAARPCCFYTGLLLDGNVCPGKRRQEYKFVAIPVKGGGFGVIGDIVVGVIGAVLGGFLFGKLEISTGGGLLGAIIVATIGAVLLIVVLRLIKRT